MAVTTLSDAFLLDHIGIPVVAFDECVSFYSCVLGVMGYTIVKQGESRAGFGVDKKPEFSIFASPEASGKNHVAFAAADRAVVDRFYETAIGAGATDNGAPDLRPEYHPNYYGAFVLDPDGNNVEAVCHNAE